MSVRSAGRGRAAARSIRLALRSLSIVATKSASLPRWVFRCRGSRCASSASIPAASRSIPLIPIPAQSITGRGQHARSTPSTKLMDGKAMVDPEREALAGLVEVDETSIPFRAQGEPARPGRSHDGKLLVAGAVEIKGKGPGRIRLAVIGDCSAVALGAFVAGNVAEGSTVVSDGWAGYKRLKDVKHEPRVVGDAPAHTVLPWVHRVFANAKRWALGVYHGLRPKHLQAYLDEFVFRFNRRRTPHAAFDRLLGLSLTLEPATYQMLVGRS